MLRRAVLERGPILLLLLGLVTLAAGVLRFIHSGHFSFSWNQALYCLLAIPAALVLLLVADYALHHARIVFGLMLVFLVLLAILFPSFCVGLGVALVGIVVTQWRR